MTTTSFSSDPDENDLEKPEGRIKSDPYEMHLPETRREVFLLANLDIAIAIAAAVFVKRERMERECWRWWCREKEREKYQNTIQ